MTNKKQAIVVTGGAGYIGSHTIIELLLNTDFHIVSLDNYSNSSKDTYDRIKAITRKSFDFFDVDICRMNELEKVLKNYPEIAGVIHFAAFKSVPESVSEPLKYYHNNINSLINILQICVKLNISNFIFSSSCSVYGNITSLPVSEKTPLNKPESPYAYTKQVGENILKDFCKTNDRPNVIALRYFNPAGAHISGLNGEIPVNQAGNLVPVITQTAIGRRSRMEVCGNDYDTRDGSCIRDYIHVSDIATAHIKALTYLFEKKQKNNYSVFNLGTGKGVSVFEAITSFEQVTGVKVNYKVAERRAGDVEAIYSDTALAEKELGWKAKYTLDQIMESAWKWEQACQKKS